MLLFILTLIQDINISKANQNIGDQVPKLKKINVQIDPCDADLAKMENYEKCIDSLSKSISQLHVAFEHSKKEQNNAAK